MFSVTIDLSPLTDQVEQLGMRRAEAVALVVEALHTAVQDVVLEDIVPATPVSAVVLDYDGSTHVHMAERWTVEQNAEGATIHNPAPYAGYVAKEPTDAYGSRVEAHYNRELRGALDQLEANITERVITALG